MSTNKPIGVIDSGVGGLSTLDKIRQLLPAEKLLYVADSAHAPYGQKSTEFIRQRCRAIMDFLLSKEAKAVVLACNTATAAAVATLREEYSLPIIGMEPALKPAAAQSRSGVIGVLATAGTIDSDKYITLQSRYAGQVEIITKACPGLVEQIESQTPDREAILALLREYTEHFRTKQGDVLVLGCTHYALISDLIQEVVGAGVLILNTGEAVARELRRRLQEAGLENDAGSIGAVEFFTSGLVAEQQGTIARYWDREITLFEM